MCYTTLVSGADKKWHLGIPARCRPTADGGLTFGGGEMGRQLENELLDMIKRKELERAAIIKRIDATGNLVMQMRQEQVNA